jgi:hypothetical protein
MDKFSFVDIDDEEDWMLAKVALASKKCANNHWITLSTMPGCVHDGAQFRGGKRTLASFFAQSTGLGLVLKFFSTLPQLW